VAEGAGAIALAALLADVESGGPAQFAGRPVAVIQTGGNVDADVFAEVLAGGTPSV
jgi:threonine dehydratase